MTLLASIWSAVGLTVAVFGDRLAVWPVFICGRHTFRGAAGSSPAQARATIRSVAAARSIIVTLIIVHCLANPGQPEKFMSLADIG